MTRTLRAGRTCALVLTTLTAVVGAACSGGPQNPGAAPGRPPSASAGPDAADATGGLARAERLFVEAEGLARDAQYARAVAAFGEAAPIYKAEGRWSRYVRCRSEMGEQSRRLARLDEAQAHLDEAVQSGKEHLSPRDLEWAPTYTYLANVRNDRGDYEDAIRGHSRAVELRLALLGGQHPDVASSYVSRAISRRSKGDYAEALADCNRALAIQIPALGEGHPDVAWTHAMLGVTYGEKGEYDRANALLEKALAVLGTASGHAIRRLASVHLNLGVGLDDRGDYDRALVHYQKALSLQTAVLGEGHPDLAGTFNNIGTLYDITGDSDQALSFYEKAVALLFAAGKGEHASIAYTYDNMGLVCFRKKDHEQAIAFLGKARSIFMKTLGDRHPETAAPDLNLGLVYTDLGEYDQAIACYKRALVIQIRSLGARHTDVASSYNNMGAAYTAKGDLPRAHPLYEKALEIRRGALGPRHPDVANIHRNLGTLYRLRGDTARAVAQHEKALAIYRTSFGPRHPEVAQSSNDIGDIYRGQHRGERALFFYEQAIRANLASPAGGSSGAAEESSRALSESVLLGSLTGKAQILSDPQRASALDLAAALSTFEEAASVLDRIRRGHRAEGSKLLLAERAADIYDRAIAVALTLHRRTGAPRYAEVAFRFAEKSKSGVLLEALVQAEAQRFAGIPDSVLAEERNLRAELAFYERAVSEEQSRGGEADPAKLGLFQDKSFERKRSYDALLERMEKQYPAYYSLKYRAQAVGPADVQRRLRDSDGALLEYFMGADSIFIFAVTKDGLRVEVVPREPGIERLVTELREGIVDRDLHLYAGAASRLYDAILRPVALTLAGKALVVVPDGSLGAIPFEALLARGEGEGGVPGRDSNLSYLLEEHAVSYAYSATLWLEPRNREAQPPGKGFLGFAPVFAPSRARGTRGAARPGESHGKDPGLRPVPRDYLPASRDEVTRIAKRVEGSYGLLDRWRRTRTRVYLGDEAREEAVKSENLADYRFVHFATHGLLDAKRPKLSGLVLAAETGGEEDGILHLGEVYGLTLNADLVVLSACETGLGQVARGEGTIGLTRGFLYAGAAKVLVSLWPVSDATTADLMVDFYDQMLLGVSEAEALREAKRRLMKRQPEYAKPYYWAPFILVGRGPLAASAM